jgi:HK97 family phage major capsid protein
MYGAFPGELQEGVMDRTTLGRLPFLAAFFVALAAMPLDIFSFNQRQVGTAKVSPWSQRLSTACARVTAGWTRCLAFLRSPGFQLAAAAAILVLVVSGQLHAEGVVLFAGLISTPDEAREQINKLGIDMSAIMAKAKAETRELTPEEVTSFDAMDTDREKLLATEKRLLKAAELDGTRGRQTEPTIPAPQQTRSAAPTPSSVVLANHERAAAVQAWLLAGAATHTRTAADVEAVRKFGLTLEQRQLNMTLGSIALRSKAREDIKEWEERYLGVDVISPDTGGHFAVPNETMRALEVALLAYGGMRTVATVLRTNTGGALPIPTMNDTNNEGAIIGEAVCDTTEVYPTLGQLVLDAYTYTSRNVLMSVEFIQDNAINAAERIGTMLGDRIARITNRHFTVGTGSGQPKGIVTAATSSGVTTASATAVSYDEIVDLVHSVDPAYRTDAKFMFHDNVLKALKKMKVPQFSGDTAGYPLWVAGMSVKEPDRIDGYAYVINQHMPLAAASQKAILFGALEKYLIRDVRDVTVMRLDELFAQCRQVAFLAFSRHDGDLLDAGTHPVKYLTMHA